MQVAKCTITSTRLGVLYIAYMQVAWYTTTSLRLGVLCIAYMQIARYMTPLLRLGYPYIAYIQIVRHTTTSLRLEGPVYSIIHGARYMISLSVGGSRLWFLFLLICLHTVNKMSWIVSPLYLKWRTLWDYFTYCFIEQLITKFKQQ